MWPTALTPPETTSAAACRPNDAPPSPTTDPTRSAVNARAVIRPPRASSEPSTGRPTISAVGPTYRREVAADRLPVRALASPPRSLRIRLNARSNRSIHHLYYRFRVRFLTAVPAARQIGPPHPLSEVAAEWVQLCDHGECVSLLAPGAHGGEEPPERPVRRVFRDSLSKGRTALRRSALALIRLANDEVPLRRPRDKLLRRPGVAESRSGIGGRSPAPHYESEGRQRGRGRQRRVTPRSRQRRSCVQTFRACERSEGSASGGRCRRGGPAL